MDEFKHSFHAIADDRRVAEMVQLNDRHIIIV